MVSGVERPLTLKPFPVRVACAIVKLALPVLVIVKDCDLETPSTTLPKLMVAGDTLIAACIPAPERLSVAGDPCASLTIEALPFAVPPAAGAYFNCSAVDCPAFKVVGTLKPLAVKPLPVTLT